MHIALAVSSTSTPFRDRLELYLIETGLIVREFDPEVRSDARRAIDPMPDSRVDSGVGDEFGGVRRVAASISAGEYEQGVIASATGHDVAFLANRYPGVRCSLCWDPATARAARVELDANVLAIGERWQSFDEVVPILESWFESAFDAENYGSRVARFDRGRLVNGATGDRFAPEAPPLPHRTEFTQQIDFVCDRCREEFSVPIDITTGGESEVVEECPVCCHENVIGLHVDAEGIVTIGGNGRLLS